MKKKIKYHTWEELVKMKEGTILRDWFDEGVRCLIMRAGGSLTAYVGVPIQHPLAGYSDELLPLDCHGGLTFASEGKGTHPKEWYWYGWDYAHSGDYCFYYDIPPLTNFNHDGDEKWTQDKVEANMWGTLYNFKKLVKLAESIVSKEYTLTKK